MPQRFLPVVLIVAVDYRDGARNQLAIDAGGERPDLAPGGERSIAHQHRQLHRNHRRPSRTAVFVNLKLEKNELGKGFFARRRFDLD